jgi:UPF0716 family protein affecting phage T7 exclusion
VVVSSDSLRGRRSLSKIVSDPKLVHGLLLSAYGVLCTVPSLCTSALCLVLLLFIAAFQSNKISPLLSVDLVSW